MSTLGRAIEIAAKAHGEDVDRGGQLYILHPIRIMMRARTIDEKIVSVLHDVVEDTEVTLSFLSRQGFQRHIIEAIDAITKREGEKYSAFIQRICLVPLAIPVKILDIEDNMDVTRLPNSLTDTDKARLEKYKLAIGLLKIAYGKKVWDGNYE
jgi:guanosine-3',5'-bis(diphosphate) 3'-pyrophosphohydrolase